MPAAQVHHAKSPVVGGAYHVPIEYILLLETALQTMRNRYRDSDPHRRVRVMRVARKTAMLAAKAIVGEVRGWLTVFPEYAESGIGFSARLRADAARVLVDAIIQKRDDATVQGALDTLLSTLHGNPTHTH